MKLSANTIWFQQVLELEKHLSLNAIEFIQNRLAQD